MKITVLFVCLMVVNCFAIFVPHHQTVDKLANCIKKLWLEKYPSFPTSIVIGELAYNIEAKYLAEKVITTYTSEKDVDNHCIQHFIKTWFDYMVLQKPLGENEKSEQRKKQETGILEAFKQRLNEVPVNGLLGIDVAAGYDSDDKEQIVRGVVVFVTGCEVLDGLQETYKPFIQTGEKRILTSAELSHRLIKYCDRNSHSFKPEVTTSDGLFIYTVPFRLESQFVDKTEKDDLFTTLWNKIHKHLEKSDPKVSGTPLYAFDFRAGYLTVITDPRTRKDNEHVFNLPVTNLKQERKVEKPKETGIPAQNIGYHNLTERTSCSEVSEDENSERLSELQHNSTQVQDEDDELEEETTKDTRPRDDYGNLIEENKGSQKDEKNAQDDITSQPITSKAPRVDTTPQQLNHHHTTGTSDIAEPNVKIQRDVQSHNKKQNQSPGVSPTNTAVPNSRISSPIENKTPQQKPVLSEVEKKEFRKENPSVANTVISTANDDKTTSTNHVDWKQKSLAAIYGYVNNQRLSMNVVERKLCKKLLLEKNTAEEDLAKAMLFTYLQQNSSSQSSAFLWDVHAGEEKKMRRIFVFRLEDSWEIDPITIGKHAVEFMQKHKGIKCYNSKNWSKEKFSMTDWHAVYYGAAVEKDQNNKVAVGMVLVPDGGIH